MPFDFVKLHETKEEPCAFVRDSPSFLEYVLINNNLGFEILKHAILVILPRFII